jgi:hypothetical protein
MIRASAWVATPLGSDRRSAEDCPGTDEGLRATVLRDIHDADLTGLQRLRNLVQCWSSCSEPRLPQRSADASSNWDLTELPWICFTFIPIDEVDKARPVCRRSQLSSRQRPSQRRVELIGGSVGARASASRVSGNLDCWLHPTTTSSLPFTAAAPGRSSSRVPAPQRRLNARSLRAIMAIDDAAFEPTVPDIAENILSDGRTGHCPTRDATFW